MEGPKKGEITLILLVVAIVGMKKGGRWANKKFQEGKEFVEEKLQEFKDWLKSIPTEIIQGIASGLKRMGFNTYEAFKSKIGLTDEIEIRIAGQSLELWILKPKKKIISKLTLPEADTFEVFEPLQERLLPSGSPGAYQFNYSQALELENGEWIQDLVWLLWIYAEELATKGSLLPNKRVNIHVVCGEPYNELSQFFIYLAWAEIFKSLPSGIAFILGLKQNCPWKFMLEDFQNQTIWMTRDPALLSETTSNLPNFRGE